MDRTDYSIKLPYISPTSLGLFYKDRQEWALRYALAERPPRMPQTQPMAVGSAFDAYVKSFLAARLKVAGWDGRLSFEALFERQVEAHNRDWARVAGLRVFEAYRDYGALADLLLELECAVGEPTFEADVAREVAYSGGSYKLFGKTDLSFAVKGGAFVVYDWKVNGYCSGSKQSPKKGYVGSRPTGRMHKNASLLSWEGIMINGACRIEETSADWAEQLVIYGWSLGRAVGDKFVVGVDQLVCVDGTIDGIYRFRGVSGSEFQNNVHSRCIKMWDACLSGHVFDELSFSDNLDRLEQLGRAFHIAPSGPERERDLWLNSICR